MFYISKKFKFEAAHQLDRLPDTHPCSRLHGHSYTVEVVLKAESLDAEKGWVMDYGDLSKLMDPIIKELDHHNLNDLGWGLPTTAECIAVVIYNKLQGKCPLAWVKVSETEKTWAIFTKEVGDGHPIDSQ
jgi:6-pyruvoyltetrahydropterin/6-carboxytetrahydropterin synthase